MKLHEHDKFSLGNFEGPLDLLWHLIHRQEIDIYEINLHEITEQFLKKARPQDEANLDYGAEFIALAASLIWYKSKTLLPAQEIQDPLNPQEENDPRFEIIHQLMDYYRFKQAAKGLAEREQSQSSFYSRGIDSLEAKKNLGINHLSLNDLATLFQHILAKSKSSRGTIEEEIWRVSDKIKSLRYMLKDHSSLFFEDVFTSEKSREELIVLFLALLELMKLGEVRVNYDPLNQKVSLLSTSN